jgi:ribonuclease E
MPNKMLIDATHPEETRVVVLRGNRVEEFDFESASRKQLRGNIYLAKVTRVEPSLQAAFVDYGGNRHGFLAFSEIHPDYYQIPVADRQALIEEEERAQREADAEADNHARRHAERGRSASQRRERLASEPIDDASHDDEHREGEHREDENHGDDQGTGENEANDRSEGSAAPEATTASAESGEAQPPQPEAAVEVTPAEALTLTAAADTALDLAPTASTGEGATTEAAESSEASSPSAELGFENGTAEEAANGVDTNGNGANVSEISSSEISAEDEAIESVGGADAMEEVPERPHRPRRQYKIQEVIKRRQVMLVQVVKEERGTKGAALTTYLSLAGRYSVLMPNTARGGGISRKITDAQDRRRLKEVAQELEVPEGMGVILRTAGASRTKMEVKRDFEYLLRLWENVRDLTLKSTAPTLVYEEGSLVKRSIRDLYSKDIDEIQVGGAEGYREARDFMRMLMPSHVKNVKPFHDTLPIFTRFGIESQLDAMFQPVVQLRSGGYIVINQTEALVAIDVNSGRATREHHIEDTALKTNLEAADEIARQLRLRDLAGLVVIDFIDMDEKRNNRTVERRLKEALKHDRARIQVGHISHFGLLEMSRQRIRSSVLESSTDKCPQCGGTGHVRSVSSVSLQLLRSIEELLLKGATHNIIVRTRTEIAIYLLNHKRAHLRTLEERFRITITVNADPTIAGQTSYVIEKGEQVHSLEQAKAIAAQPIAAVPIIDEDDEKLAEEEDVSEEDEVSEGEEAGEDAELETADAQSGEASAQRDGRGRRRRRRRGRRGGEAREGGPTHETVAEHAVVHAVDDEGAMPTEADAAEASDDGEPGERAADGRRRRRGRRGGRRNRRGRDGDGLHAGSDAVAESDVDQGLDVVEHAASSAASFEPAEPYASSHEVRVTETVSEPTPPVPSPPEPTIVTTASDGAPPETPGPVAAPRRRSTVREPAPVGFSSVDEPIPPTPVPPQPVEIPQPVVSESGETSEQPRRSGWWRRR